MKIIVCGLPGTGKTGLCKEVVKRYNYTYYNDWSFSSNKPIVDSLIKALKKDENAIFDLQYSILPVECKTLIKRFDCKVVYLGFISLSLDVLFKLFRDSETNNNKTDDELLNEVKHYIVKSKEVYKLCKKENLKFYDINRDRKQIMKDIILEIFK